MDEWERLQQEARRRVREREQQLSHLPAPPPPAEKTPARRSSDDRGQLLLFALALFLCRSEAPPELILAILYIAAG